ncbi:MAG: hypothetical protein AAF304_09895, partial [Pseudomonadota bacterium]
MLKRKLNLSIIFITLCWVSHVYAVDLELVAKELDAPILLTHTNSPEHFLVEKTGKVFVYDVEFESRRLFLDVSS